MTVEYAALSGLEYGSPFSGLAKATGFSVRDCRLAAVTGRLPELVRIAEVRKREAASPAYTRRLSGRLALALVRAREHGL